MARISSNVLQGLSSPSFMDGMFTAGAALGNIPNQLREKQKQEQFNKIMDLANRAIVANDPVNLGRARRQLQELGYTEEANKLAQAQIKAEQQQTRVGMFQEALGLPTGFTPEQKVSYLAKGATLEDIEAASKAGIATMDPIRDKARGRLRAMARNKNFDTSNTRMLDAYLAQARKFYIDENEAMKILSEERGTPFEREKARATASGRAGTTTFAGANNYLDKRNLEYRLTEVRDPTGEGAVRTEYQPVGHKIPYEFSYEDEQGNIIDNRLTQKGGAYGETAGQRTARYEEEQEIRTGLDITKADIIKENENFSDVRMKAAARLPQVEGTLSDVNELLDIIERVDQGGSIVGLQNRISRVLGREAKDEGDLRTRAKELLVGRIKAFGANPTEGERQYLEQLIPDLENSEGVNKKILERLQQRLQRERASIGYLFTEKANLDGYISFVNEQYSGDPNSNITGNKRVKFDEIQ